MLGFLSKRRLWKSLRVSDQKSMPELVPIGKFGGSDGAEEETEMILGNDSSTQRRGFGRAEFDSFFNRVVSFLDFNEFVFLKDHLICYRFDVNCSMFGVWFCFYVTPKPNKFSFITSSSSLKLQLFFVVLLYDCEDTYIHLYI